MLLASVLVRCVSALQGGTCNVLGPNNSVWWKQHFLAANALITTGMVLGVMLLLDESSLHSVTRFRPRPTPASLNPNALGFTSAHAPLHFYSFPFCRPVVLHLLMHAVKSTRRSDICAACYAARKYPKP